MKSHMTLLSEMTVYAKLSTTNDTIHIQNATLLSSRDQIDSVPQKLQQAEKRPTKSAWVLLHSGKDSYTLIELVLSCDAALM